MIMTAKEVSRYIALSARKLYILLHCGVDWHEGMSEELLQIEDELRRLRPLVDEEHERRGKS